MDKQRMLDKLAREWYALLTAVYRVPIEALETTGVGGSWSVKDVLGHITVWEEETVKAAEAGRSGLDIPSYGDMDEWNEADVIRRRARPAPATLVEMGAVHQRFVSWLEGLPDDAFSDADLAATVDGESAEHYREHRADIEAWLTARGA